MIAVMNQVIEVGLQIIAERNNRKKEAAELEDELLLLGQEYEMESKTLGNMITVGPSGPSKSSRSSNALPHMTRTDPLRRSVTKKGKEVRKGNRRDHDDRTGPSLSSSQHLSPKKHSWESSSPATHLPRQQMLSGDDEDALSVETESSAQPRITQTGKREIISEDKSETAIKSNLRNDASTHNDGVSVKVKVKPIERDQGLQEKGLPSGAKMRGSAVPATLQVEQPSADSKAGNASNPKGRVIIKRRLQQAAEGSKRSRSGAAAK